MAEPIQTTRMQRPPGAVGLFTTFYADILDRERLHQDSGRSVDHLQLQDAPVLEGWTALTYMAACYPSFHFGNVVLAQSFRNPALLAKMAATAQYMNEGRFILGIGAGWHQEEYDAYGFPYPTPGVRVEQLEETLTLLNEADAPKSKNDPEKSWLNANIPDQIQDKNRLKKTAKQG